MLKLDEKQEFNDDEEMLVTILDSKNLRIGIKVSAKGASHRLNSQFVKAPQSGANSTRGNRGEVQMRETSLVFSASARFLRAPPAWPNHSLNRTHCSGPSFGL